MMPVEKNPDNDLQKGTVENGRDNDSSLAGQLPHREADPLIKANDTDFPEPGENPEHTGQREDDAEGVEQDEEPGDRQKRIHGDEKEDPLAA
jgi:hypothetical protein